MTTSTQTYEAQLRRAVERLATEIGPRHLGRTEAMTATVAYLEDELRSAGLTARRHPFRVDGQEVVNVVAELPGRTEATEVVLVGAHYDTVPECPGANDNGSGVAGVLALARRLAAEPQQRTIRFLFFANEEPPYFQTDAMGSLVYARELRRGQERIVAMFSLETIGSFSDEPGSQRYPEPLGRSFPDRANFIGFVANAASQALLQRAVDVFRAHETLPVQGAALPESLPGVGWSDHWSFWQAGYPAMMVTDTAPFRYQAYHTPQDTPDKLDFRRMAQVVAGFEQVVRAVANPRSP